MSWIELVLLMLMLENLCMGGDVCVSPPLREVVRETW